MKGRQRHHEPVQHRGLDARPLDQDLSVLTLQDDDDLQVFGAERLGGELVEGAPSLHGVADDERRHQEDAVAPQRVLHLNIQLGHRDHLPLRRHRPSDHLEGNRRGRDINACCCSSGSPLTPDNEALRPPLASPVTGS